MPSSTCLQGLVRGGRVGLGAQVGGRRAGAREVAGEDRLDEGAEDELGSTGLRKGQPQREDELEGVVEWEPVHGVDGRFKDGQEGEDNPVGQPLGVIRLARTEKGIERVVAWDDEAGEVGQEGAGNVEEDEEEVEADEAKEGVDLWHRGLLLEVVEHWVLGQLFVDQRNVLLGLILERHLCGR